VVCLIVIGTEGTVPAHAGAGGELLHLGLQDEASEFAQQSLALGQRKANLLRRQPDNPSFEPADLDRLHFARPVFASSFSTTP
jgi:hypothetical protein